jgi:proline iminopeptidase
MPAFTAYDGTELAYHLRGSGEPLVCVPGGPGLDSSYLDDLGGLSERFQLVLLDNRGTGKSAAPDDPSTYRCDHLVDDVEALREQLGLTRLTLLGHSAGANVVVSYAARHPERVARLVLVNPSTRAVGVDITVDDRRPIVARRADEPWFAEASAAFERLNSGQGSEEDATAIAPLFYGRWDEQAQTHYATCERLRNQQAAATFGAEGAFRPEATRKALATLEAPVLVLGGEVDANTVPDAIAKLAGLFPRATVVMLPGSGHFSWLDDPAWVQKTVTEFLTIPLPTGV